MKNTYSKVTILSIFLMFCQNGYSQNSYFTFNSQFNWDDVGDATGFSIEGEDLIVVQLTDLIDVPSGVDTPYLTQICESPGGYDYSRYNDCSQTDNLFLTNPGSAWAVEHLVNGSGLPPGQDFMKAEVGETIPFKIQVDRTGDGMLNGDKPKYHIRVEINYSIDGGLNYESIISSNTFWDPNTQGDTYFETVPLKIPSGFAFGGITVSVESESWIGLKLFASFPFWAEGTIAEEVDILAQAPLPKTVEVVLEAPPGDASSLTFTDSRKSCREISSAVIDEFGNESDFAVSVGFEGSVGIGVMTEIEATVDIGAGINVSNVMTSSTTTERCVELTSGFVIPAASAIGDDQTLFIGYGGTRFFGEFRKIIEGETGSIQIQSGGLTYYDKAEGSPFIFTIPQINDEITGLEAIRDNTSLSLEARNDADNQIKAWTQELADHATNLAEKEFLFTKTISNGSTQTVEEATTVTKTQSFEMDFTLGSSFGAGFTVEAAGNGISGTTEFTMSQTRSNGTTNGTENSKILNYVLADDEQTTDENGGADLFVIDIYRNKVYGTPIFVLDESQSKTSCPYEGGYQRDQPSLTAEDINCSGLSQNLGLQTTNINDAVNPILNICNNSVEPRNYTVRLIENFNNANVILNGAVMGLNTNVTYTTIPAGGCVEDGQGNKPILTITRDPNAPTNMAFLKFVIYPTCLGDNLPLFETQEFTIDVQFGSENPRADSDCDAIINSDDLCPNEQDVSLNFENRGEQSGNTSDHIVVPHDPAFNLVNGDFTFEAWVNPSSGADTRAIVTKGSGQWASSNYLFDIIRNDDTFWGAPGRLGLFLFAGGSIEGEFGNSVIPLNTWTHVAVSVNNSGSNPVATFYINGIMDGTKTYNFATNSLNNTNTDPLLIGRQGSNTQTNHFEGKLDEVAVWAKSLTTAEIAASMAAPYTGSESGIVAYYDFNDADGCVTNGGNITLIDKANGHDGTLQNFMLTAGCVSNWADGHNQGACPPPACPVDADSDALNDCVDLCPNERDVSLNFENRGEQSGNTSDHIVVPHDPAFNLVNGDFTFEAWVNPSSGADTRSIVTKGSGQFASSNYLFDIIRNDDTFWGAPGRLGLFLFAGGSVEGEFGNSVIPLNTWTHVAVSVNNSGSNPVATFYINGAVDGTSTFNFTTSSLNNTNTSPLLIGRQGSSTQTNHFEGKLDEVAVWAKSLTTAEIAASMAAPYTGSESGLVAYYDFNDADGCVANGGNTTLIDKANGHDGTLQNFMLTAGCISNWADGHNQGACQPACPPNLDLTSTQSSNAVYSSGGYISSDQTINSPAQVDYDATTEISLLEGFEVKAGALFHAFIDGCGNALRQISDALK